MVKIIQICVNSRRLRAIVIDKLTSNSKALAVIYLTSFLSLFRITVHFLTSVINSDRRKDIKDQSSFYDIKIDILLSS